MASNNMPQRSCADEGPIPNSSSSDEHQAGLVDFAAVHGYDDAFRDTAKPSPSLPPVLHSTDTAMASITAQVQQQQHLVGSELQRINPNLNLATELGGSATGGSSSLARTNRSDHDEMNSESVPFDSSSLKQLAAAAQTTPVLEGTPGGSSRNNAALSNGSRTGGMHHDGNTASTMADFFPNYFQQVPSPSNTAAAVSETAGTTAARDAPDVRDAQIAQQQQQQQQRQQHLQQQQMVHQGGGRFEATVMQRRTSSALDYADPVAAGGGQSAGTNHSLLPQTLHEQLPPPLPNDIIAAFSNHDPETQRLILEYVTRRNQILYELLLARSTTRSQVVGTLQQQELIQQPPHHFSALATSIAPGIHKHHQNTAVPSLSIVAAAAGLLPPPQGRRSSSSAIAGASDQDARPAGARLLVPRTATSSTTPSAEGAPLVATAPAAATRDINSNDNRSSSNMDHPISSSSSSSSPSGSFHLQNAIAAEQQPQKPKRVRTAYNFFFMDERVRLAKQVEELQRHHHRSQQQQQQQQPQLPRTLGFEELGREIGKRWNKLDSEQKRHYQEKAAEDKKRYDQEFAAYQEVKRDELEAKRQRQEATVTDSARKLYLATEGARLRKKSKRKGT